MPIQSRTVVGQFNSGNLDQRNVQPNFSQVIQQLMPAGSAPLFALTGEYNRQTITDIKFGYYTETLIFPEFTLTADATAQATTLDVDSTEFMIPGMVFQSQATGEQIIVNAVLSATSISVQRGSGAAAITIASVDPSFYQTGNAHEEGSIRPQAQALNPVYIDNLTQIFRNTYAVTGTVQEVKTIAGDDTVSRTKQLGAQLHATAIETALIFGRRSQGMRNGQPFRTMDGLISVLENPDSYPVDHGPVNVYTAPSSGVTPTMLEDMLDPVFNTVSSLNEPNRRIVFCGGTSLRAFNDLARKNGNYQLTQGQTEFGLRFTTFHFTRGTFELIEHPLFNAYKNYKSYALVVEPSSFNIGYLGGRDTQNRVFNQDGTTAQDNGIDAVGGTLTTECSALVKNPSANALIKNFTKGLVDA